MHRWDSLEIINDGIMIGTYCGQRTGQNILLTGYQILLKFRSRGLAEGRGFLIHFNAVPHGK